MAFKIRWSDNAIKDYEAIVFYLKNDWNEDIAIRFMEVVEYKVMQVSLHPFIGRMAFKDKSVRSILLTKHNRLYYRFLSTELIEIANIYDTRQNPKKNTFE